MSKTTRWLVFVIALLAITVAVLLWRRQPPPPAAPAPPQVEPQVEAPSAAAPPATPGPEITYPIDIARGTLEKDKGEEADKEHTAASPPLDESDPVAVEVLTGLMTSTFCAAASLSSWTRGKALW